MLLKKYAVCAVMGLLGMLSAGAQDLIPEALPKHSRAEKKVIEVKAVTLPDFSVTPDFMKPASTAATTASNNSFGESVVKTALQYLGARYRSGMQGPNAFDCSGFTSFVYGRENVKILRSSRSQYTQGTPISQIADLKKGDLVFFGGRGSHRSVGHVGIVTDVDPEGNKFSFVHASSSGGVRISSSNETYYSRRYIGARRIVE
ncbi:C40 family peptidase [Prevotellamassilia timonensis]|uniref:C40 family peptidase n=1 Tax=Prevotellamassilia timonensis TaxID=1852370 RepID=UPI001F3A09E3|nr:C40 family peptidase [Prevotellamassilia timonensis]MCI5508812.1 C40 family peptidase [Bacteroidales bacterium]